MENVLRELPNKSVTKIRKEFNLIPRRENGAILWHKPTLSVFNLDSQHSLLFKKILDSTKSRISVTTKEYESLIKMERLIASRNENNPDNNNIRRLNLMVSQKCELNCAYCYGNGGTYGTPSKMTSKVAKEAVSFFAEFFAEITSIQFFGGEPLLNIHVIEDAIRYAGDLVNQGKLKKSPDFAIVTGLAVPNLDNVVRLLKNFPAIRLLASCDGPENIHDFLRPYKSGAPSFNTVSKNLDLLRALDQPKSIELTYTKLHMDNDLSPSFLRTFFKERFGIKQIIIIPVVTSRTDLALPPKKIASIIFEESTHAFESVKTKSDINCQNWLVSRAQNILHSSPTPYLCDLGISNFTIDTNGNIFPCQMLVGIQKNQFKIANIFEDRVKLKESILHSTETWKRITKKSQYGQCNGCLLQNYCTGCPASDYLLRRQFKPSFIICDKKKRFIKRLLKWYVDFLNESEDRKQND